MAYVPVVSYDAVWNPKNNTYEIRVLIAGNTKAIVVPVNTESEYSAVLTMLGKAGVQIDVATGALKLPPRPVGT